MPRLAGLALDADGFRRALADPNVAVIDLTLGGWRPRQAARDLAAALGRPLPPVAGPAAAASGDAAGLGHATGAAIDAEARGRGPQLRAELDIEALLAAPLPPGLRILLLPPRFGLPLRAADAAFLQLLAAEASLAEVAWTGHSEPADATAALAALLPGGAEAALAPALGSAGLRSAAGQVLVDPGLRADPRRAPPQHFPRLAALVPDAWVRAYAAMFGPNLYADPGLLTQVAAAAAAGGAPDLAADFLERLQACAATPADRAAAVARRQGLGIATHRFEEIAHAVAPAGAPPALRGQIELTRAWGKVMIGEAAAARAVFEPHVAEIARPGRPVGVDDLYTLNIAALARLRCGDHAGAEALEETIRAHRAALPHDDPQLAYVNLLNLSRLRRRAGDFAAARDLQRQAFRTVEGVMQPWEAFHFEVLEGLVADGLGEPAWPHWARAALVWLSARSTASVPERALRALLGPKASADDPAMAETVEAALLARLGPSWTPAACVAFGRLAPGDRTARVHDLGWALLAEAALHGPVRETALNAALAGLLAEHGLAGAPALAIDLSRGLGLERGPAAALALARRTGALEIVREGVAGPPSRAATADVRLNAAAQVASTPDGVRVLWRRHRAPVILAGAEAAMALRAAAGPTTVQAGDLDLARSLEARQVVRLEWTEGG